MGYTASKVVEIAKAEIGYHEKNSDANLDVKVAINDGSGNHTKYARDLHKAGYYNGDKCGYAWCDCFYDWVHLQAAGGNAKLAQAVICQTGPYGAGCTNSMQYYKNQGRLDMNPKVGDQIFFRYSGTSGADHTGIVVAVESQWITTIEGNSGNCVQQRRYDRRDSTIVGYGHPKYDAEKVEEKKDTVKPQASTTKHPTVRKGSTGAAVKEMQQKLIALGYSCGSKKDDGDFGTNTYNAVVKFQRDHGLDPDGICGPLTWAALDSAKPTAKTIDQIAREVIAGKWGNGSERKRKLTQAGYDYAAVQKRVNELV